MQIQLKSIKKAGFNSKPALLNADMPDLLCPAYLNQITDYFVNIIFLVCTKFVPSIPNASKV
jgi:hypothetical protein